MNRKIACSLSVVLSHRLQNRRLQLGFHVAGRLSRLIDIRRTVVINYRLLELQLQRCIVANLLVAVKSSKGLSATACTKPGQIIKLDVHFYELVGHISITTYISVLIFNFHRSIIHSFRIEIFKILCNLGSILKVEVCWDSWRRRITADRFSRGR
jgi:hypothetical protein